MRWPLRRKEGPSEATLARITAEHSYRRTQAETPRYRELADALRDLRERNHLAEAINKTFRKRGRDDR